MDAMMNDLSIRHQVDLQLPPEPSFDELVEVGESIVAVREHGKFLLGQLARIVTDLHGTQYGDKTLIRFAHMIGMEHPDQVYAYRDVWDYWGAPLALPNIHWSHYRLLQLRFPADVDKAKTWLAYASGERLSVRQLASHLTNVLQAASMDSEDEDDTPQLDGRYRYQIPGRWKGDAELLRCDVHPDGIHVELIIPIDSLDEVETISQLTAVTISIEGV